MDAARDSQGIVCDLSPDARRVLVTFGGLGGGVGAFAAELSRQERDVPRSTIYLSDPAAAWWHQGIAGMEAEDIDSVADRLRELTAGAEEVVMLGIKTGGYAALLFGALLDCEAHVFNPETILDPALMHNRRRGRRIEELHGDLDPRYVDLAPVIAASAGRFHVYHAGGGLNAAHAARLADMPQVTLHELDYSQGDVVNALRAQGWLQSFLRGLVDGEGVPELPDEIRDPRPEDAFARALEPAGMAYNLEADAPRVFISFAGLRGGQGVAPAFEFVKSLDSQPVKTIYVRMNEVTWYHEGVPGVGPDVDSVVEHLQEQTGDAEQVVVIGNCGGGYAAVLFGALLNAEAHAFCPQTFLDAEMRRLHDETRWGHLFAAMDGRFDPRYVDLLPVIAESDARIHIYYPEHHVLDTVHAERVGDLPQVTLHPFDYAGSDLVRALRSCGWLASFVDSLVNGTPIPDAPAEIPAPDTGTPARRPSAVRTAGA
jgi:hypothetical protein